MLKNSIYVSNKQCTLITWRFYWMCYKRWLRYLTRGLHFFLSKFCHYIYLKCHHWLHCLALLHVLAAMPFHTHTRLTPKIRLKHFQFELMSYGSKKNLTQEPVNVKDSPANNNVWIERVFLVLRAGAGPGLDMKRMYCTSVGCEEQCVCRLRSLSLSHAQDDTHTRWVILSEWCRL